MSEVRAHYIDCVVVGEGAVDRAVGGHAAAEDGADQEGDREDQGHR